MDWLVALDTALFRFCNGTLANSFFDGLMPLASQTTLLPLFLVGLTAFCWRGGRRARLAVAFLVVAVALGDGLVINSLKEAIGRVRPGAALPEARVLVGLGRSESMPSAHAANWFAAATVLALYFRRSLCLTLPLASLVAFSRVYNGVHYPSDVLVGALLGAAYGAGLVVGAEWLWQAVGPRWFRPAYAVVPTLWRERPDLVQGSSSPPPAMQDADWLRLGYVVVGVLLLARLVYIHSNIIQLSEDEAYQWHWSKRLDLSYYSKPPMIAYAQFAGTALCGDNELGVRFFSPVIAAILAILLLRFFAREAGLAQTGVWMIAVACATPLLAVGATLMTIDPLSVLFWTAAVLAGWRAIKDDSTRSWAWCGLWMGLGFLSKYVALFQWLCWAVFFTLWKPARAQLRRPGPWVALGLNLVATLPVLAWNAQHNWITLTHLGERGGLDRAWQPTLRFFAEFLGAEAGLLNPVYFVGAVWATLAFWRRDRTNPLMLYLFSMGTPLFIVYLLYSLRSRVLPNWIAPAVLPLFCLMALYWTPRLAERGGLWKRVFLAGTLFGFGGVVLLHDTDLVSKLTGLHLPARADPKRRVYNWARTADAVEAARAELERTDGRSTFIIGNHYGITSLVTFYNPAAKAAFPERPQVFYLRAERPKNQFWFWPSYQDRTGQNAIFVMETDRAKSPPASLVRQFAGVTDLGVQEIRHEGRVFHRIQLFACRNLQGP